MRKARNSHKTKEIDLMKPIMDVFSFGTKDDPCFGKHYLPSAKECMKCGDSELCVIAMAQKAKVKRAKQKETTSMKDEEEVSIDVNNALKNIVVTNQITNYVKVCKLIQKKFSLVTLDEAKNLVKQAVKELKQFKVTKIDGKRTITYRKP